MILYERLARVYCPQNMNRREFLGGIFTAAALPQARPHRIDTHHHHFPPQLDPFYRVRPAENPTPGQRIERMDQNGIAGAILSVAGAGIPVETGDRARAITRSVNEEAAKLCHDYPGRLGFFAALPLFDLEGSLQELAHAFDVLNADGINLVTSYEGRWPGDASFAPMWDELNRRKAVVYFHPTDPTCCRNLTSAMGVTSPAMEYPFDTARAIVSLITSGTVLRCPDVRLIFSHGGGAIAAVYQRLDWYINDNKKGSTIPNGVAAELRKLYFDTVFVTNRAMFAALTQLMPANHLLFGTDFPYYPLPGMIKELNGLGLSTGVLRGIERNNALTLFPRFTRGA